MKKPRSAGELQHRVAFDKRFDVTVNSPPDSPSVPDYGVTVGDWEEQFQERVGFIHLRGSETVMQSRLQSQHPLVMYVRASERSRGITPEWRARDIRTGITYNIRDVTPNEDRRWIDILCQSGMADG